MPNAAPRSPTAVVVSPLRRALLWLYLLVTLGTLADLLLGKHWKELTQWPPLVLLGLGTVVGVWHLVSGGRASLRALQVAGWATVPATAAGLFFHVRANIEWARDDDASLSGWPLVYDTLFGTLPTLAPGAMLYVGLLAVLYAWRHPALGPDFPSPSE